MEAPITNIKLMPSPLLAELVDYFQNIISWVRRYPSGPNWDLSMAAVLVCLMERGNIIKEGDSVYVRMKYSDLMVDVKWNRHEVTVTEAGTGGEIVALPSIPNEVLDAAVAAANKCNYMDTAKSLSAAKAHARLLN